ncbi:hypothetical protein JHD48_00840 [Sulfurimonas sp. SAG-AH-194-I05]|nr:hypothetical protein [Sulfurimonas sp. SAG-AH-194-I05]MDF1874274.1 hypothetical protein [Sulfurimonas sp. SAG-AH-194-I05]
MKNICLFIITLVLISNIDAKDTLLNELYKNEVLSYTHKIAHYDKRIQQSSSNAWLIPLKKKEREKLATFKSNHAKNKEASFKTLYEKEKKKLSSPTIRRTFKTKTGSISYSVKKTYEKKFKDASRLLSLKEAYNKRNTAKAIIDSLAKKHNTNALSSSSAPSTIKARKIVTESKRFSNASAKLSGATKLSQGQSSLAAQLTAKLNAIIRKPNDATLKKSAVVQMSPTPIAPPRRTNQIPFKRTIYPPPPKPKKVTLASSDLNNNKTVLKNVTINTKTKAGNIDTKGKLSMANVKIAKGTTLKNTNINANVKVKNVSISKGSTADIGSVNIIK